MKKNIKKAVLLTILTALFLLLGGCMDTQDINERFIVTTTAVDKVEDEFILYVEVANIQNSSGGTDGGAVPMGSKYFYVKGSGKDLDEARQDIDRQLEHSLYIGGIRTLLLTERFASNDEDLVQYLYRVRSEEEYRKKVETVITRTSPDDLFQALNDRNVSVGYSIDNTLTSLQRQGESFIRSTARILENLSSNYTGLLMPCFDLRDDQTDLVGYSVISGHSVIGFIPIEESKGIHMLKADKAIIFYSVPYEDNVFSVESKLSKRTVTTQYQNNEISFIFTLHFKSTVEYGSKKTPYNLEKDALKKVDSTLKQMMLESLLHTVNQAQNQFQTDYLQLDDAFRIKYPAAFESLNWQEVFVKVKIYFDIQTETTVSPSMDYGEYKTR